MTLQEQLALKLTEARQAYESGDVEQGDALKADAEKLSKSIKALSELTGIETQTKSVLRPQLPGAGNGAFANGGSDKPAEPTEDVESPTVKAVYSMRFGDENAAKQAVLTDMLGKNYRQTVWDQNAAFAKYLRGGEMALDRDQVKLLKSQIFAFEDIEGMIKNGFSVAEIKSTMVEAQGTLGGFAVPTTLQSEIIRRLPGLTAVRGGGATVVNLTTGNSTEYIELTGGNKQYISALRGAWGSETQVPTEKNITIGTKAINADIYTYKVPMSQSLVEDAANLVNILQDDAALTMAMDEDAAFLTGDGVGKPLGIIPGSANFFSLDYGASGVAAALSADGLKATKRALASQYRQGAVWVMASDTALAVEKLKDGDGQYLFTDLSDQDQLLGRKVYESESMPAIAANAFPVIFGNMMGYYIVERSGMTIARYQDSNTGINKVEYHFRRRVGGRVVKPWLFCLNKIATS